MPNSVWENLIKISTAGRNPSPVWVSISNLDSCELAIDGQVKDWFAFDANGFSRNFVTGKKVSLKCHMVITPGDAGNDYIAGMTFALGTDAQSKIQATFPSGTVVTGDMTVNVTKGLGNSDDPNGLDFEILFDGKPTVSTSTSNNLTNLVLATATLYPTFAGATSDYVATTTGASVTVTPTFSAGTCTITANGASQQVASGAASSAISAGTSGTVTPITIVVAETGKTPRTYTVRLTKTA